MLLVRTAEGREDAAVMPRPVVVATVRPASGFGLGFGTLTAAAERVEEVVVVVVATALVTDATSVLPFAGLAPARTALVVFFWASLDSPAVLPFRMTALDRSPSGLLTLVIAVEDIVS